MFGWRDDRFYDVWDELARMRGQMQRTFAREPFWQEGGVFPAVNVYDDGESFVVRAEVPGIDPADLDIQAVANTVVIKGERRAPVAADKVSYHRRERDHGSFNRSISLPVDVDPDKVRATYRLGVLEVVLPKAEKARPRRVEIAG